MCREAIIALVCFAVVFTGCGHGGVGRGLSMKNMGKEKTVEKSGSTPEWAIKKPMFIKDGILYSSGNMTGIPNLSSGLIAANKRAQANIVDSLKEHLQRTFREATEGLDINQTDMQHMIFSSSEAIVSGFFVNEQYYEKKEVQTPTGVAYKYDCYALAEVTQENYFKALDGVLNGYQKKGVISEEFRRKVDQKETEFFKRDQELNVVVKDSDQTADSAKMEE